MTTGPTIALLGAGRAAGALHHALTLAGHRCLPLWSRSETTVEAARRDGFDAVSGRLPAHLAAADLVVLAVSDAAVAPLSQSLSQAGLLRPGATVIHLAGSLDLTPLSGLPQTHPTGSLHPLVSLAHRRAALRGGFAAIDGTDDTTITLLEQLAESVGLKTLRPVGDRALYHAAACLAGNYPQLLLAAASSLLERCGLGATDARAAMTVLARSAVENFGRQPVDEGGSSPSIGLTGPAVRGDSGTVARHLSALDGDPQLAMIAALYRAGAALAVTHAPEESQARLTALLLERGGS